MAICETTVSAANLALNYTGPGTITYNIEPEILADRVEGTGQVPTTTFARGSNIVNYFVEEPGGCTSECSFNVKVERESTQAIDFQCQDVTFAHTNPLDVRAAFQAGILQAEDNCGPVPVELTQGFLTGCNAAGTTQEVRASVGTGSFRQTCTFNLTLAEQDFTPACPFNAVFVRLGDEFPQALPAQDIANWTDSPEITATTDMPFIDCGDIGRHFITVTLEDKCGNSSSCTRDVRVVDRERPVIVCQDVTRSLDENGQAFINYSDVLVSVEDNCGIENLTYTLDQTLFTCDDRGTTEFFLSVEDQGGERALCRTNITITDEIDPVINCKDITIDLDETDSYTLGVADVVASASDNCSLGYTFSKRTFTCDDLANSPITVTMGGRDPANNSSTCTSLVTITEPECPCLPASNVLIVNNPEDVALCADMTVSSVQFLEGGLDLQGYELTIETASGRIFGEDESKRVFDFAGGSVVANNLTESDQNLIADLGIQMGFSSPDPFRFNEMRRTTLPVIIGEGTSIQRVLTLDHDFSEPFGMIWIEYLEAELNGIPEEELVIFIEQNGEWSILPNTGRNTAFNYLTFDIDFNDYTSPLRMTLAPASALLPLDLLSFTGEARDKTNVLTWTTANEEGFSHFEVQRSADGRGYWSVLTQSDLQASGVIEQEDTGAAAGAGQGQKSYVFTDATPLPQNYYRLRMVDLDGSFSYSSIVELHGATDATSLRVFPNPSAGIIQLALPNVEGDLNLALYTLHGTRVRAQKIGEGTVNLRMEEALPPGIYLVAVTAKNGERWTRRVVVR